MPAEPVQDHVHPAGRVAPACSVACRPTQAGPTRAHPGRPCPTTPTGARRWHPEDRSVQIHACHGRARQVEVIRDAILHALAEDPSSNPAT